MLRSKLGKLFVFSKLQFLNLETGSHDIHIRGLLTSLYEEMYLALCVRAVCLRLVMNSDDIKFSGKVLITVETDPYANSTYYPHHQKLQEYSRYSLLVSILLAPVLQLCSYRV